MRLRGVALKAVRQAMTLFEVARCMTASSASAASASAIVAHGREVAKAGLKALGDRHLSGRAAQDDLAGRIKPLSRQSVDDIIPSAGLDLVEDARRLGATSAGNHRNDARVGSERLGMGGRALSRHDPLNGQNPTAKSLKGLRP